MAKNSVLRIAISKLEKQNLTLLEKRNKSTKDSEKDEITKTIQRNESMILDYKYRLEHDLG